MNPHQKLLVFQVNIFHENNFNKILLKASRSNLDENQIQNWLNHKFPNGFNELEKALERLDAKQTGTVKTFIDFFKNNSCLSVAS